MIFTTPLGLIALLAIPAIVVIHFFRQRFPPRPAAGLFLWQMAPQTPESGRKLSRLPITASLILECLAALALALILAGARVRPNTVNTHLVALLDDSASMAAIDSAGESPRDRAVRRVLQEAENLGANARVTLVLSGERPSVLLGPAARTIDLRPALDKWKPYAPHHSVSAGLRLARELTGTSGRLMVLSDAPPDAEKEGASNSIEGIVWDAAGKPLANAGIVAAQRTVSPREGKGTISLTVANYSDSPVQRQLTLKVDGREIVSQNIVLAPGITPLNLPLAPGLPAVTATLSNDSLRRDNEVVLVEPRLQEVGVENHLPEGRGKEALSKALSAVSGATPAEHGHLSFVKSAELEAPPAPGVWRVGFGAPPATLARAGEAQDFIGPFVSEKRDALLEGVTLAGVAWTGALPLAPGVHPLVSAGGQPLIAWVGARPESGILFNIDLDRTNLIRAPDWPILISNLVEMRRQGLPGPERWNYRIGEWIRIRLGREPKAPLRIRYSGIEHPLPSGSSLEFTAPATGGLLQVMEGDDVLYELGVNFFDEQESDLRSKSTCANRQVRKLVWRHAGRIRTGIGSVVLGAGCPRARRDIAELVPIHVALPQTGAGTWVTFICSTRNFCCCWLRCCFFISGADALPVLVA